MKRREAIAALMALPETVRLSVARPAVDDVVVLEVEWLLSLEDRARLAAQVRSVWPDRKVIVLDRRMRMKFASG